MSSQINAKDSQRLGLVSQETPALAHSIAALHGARSDGSRALRESKHVLQRRTLIKSAAAGLALGASKASVAAPALTARTANSVCPNTALDAAIARLAETANGPRFVTIKISDDPVPRSLPVRDATFIKNRFRGHLGLTPS